MKFEGNRKLAITLIMLGVIISFFGGTVAYWSWETSEEQKTMVSVEVQGATLTIVGGNVEKEGMYPTAYCDGEAALIGDVATVTAVNGTASDMEVILKIRATLSVSQGTLTADKKAKINFALVDTSDGTTCSTTPYKGTLRGATTNTDIDTGIRFTATKNSTTTKSYRIYVWLDSTYTHTNSGDVISDPMQNLSISVKFSESSELSQEKGNAYPNDPVLDEGMIPITISADGVATTVSSTDSSWYDYSNKEWANVVLVKESGTQTRSYYQSNTGVTVSEDDILAYYVWIPRYKYKIWTLSQSAAGNEQTIDIVFESASASVTEGSAVGDYITHPAFVWDGSPVAGLWVGKFETGHTTLSSSTTSNNLGCTDENCSNADGIVIKPNVISLRYNRVSNQFYASRSMTRSGNPFGLSSSTTDSHMMKNSEWGAVAYLSHSQYGIDREIRINNNNSYTTGCGASTENGVNTSACEIAYGSDITEYPQSTTGNITGIFDMSGGAYEYVMGNYGNTIGSSGFTTLPSIKYYDLYSSTHFTGNYNTNMGLCTLETCGGHALSETSGWYSDSQYFVYANAPWFKRGGFYIYGATAGAFFANYGSGSADIYGGFRSVVIVGT